MVSTLCERWYFDLVGEKHNSWIWQVCDEHGNVMKTSTVQFPYYLDCFADAKRSGFECTPHFRPLKLMRRK